ncbi:hypothetical protein F5Y16DRAFT_371332 [Xylariaceae sp. FL0255]|nr:hypothetical protein F5Y16DRAFT_371332 [Xylariaceae sp. FL0255]
MSAEPSPPPPPATAATASSSPPPDTNAFATTAEHPLPKPGNDHDNEDDAINVACHVVAPDHPTSPKHLGLHSPPDSNSAMKLDGSDSELSDVEDPTLDPDHFIRSDPLLPSVQSAQNADADKKGEVADEDEDIGDVTPDHWSGTVPVFKPNMFQFKDFKKFMAKIDSYGMKSGIVKVIPPQEWKDNLPQLDDLVKQVRVREPIKQDIMGSNGTYRQVNILHQRSYNLPQWRQLCDQSEHQPPARRGERRAQAPPKPKPANSSTSTGPKRTASGRGRGRPSRNSARSAVKDDERPLTPVSPRPSENILDSVEQDPGADLDEDEDDEPRPVGRMGRMGGLKAAKPPKEQSTSARRKYARREGSAKIDEEAFKHFDYQMDISDYTAERCEELERIYWKTLTYAPPLYGADVLGTLFDDSTETWNLNKLPNLLDVLGTKVPGVNTAYLYLGMWKATFAWHLEDVDLYSINYLHFGAPKQWYSISQGDARRFEAAMKSIWPTDAKACDQFLRHKAFLISPNHLQQYFNIKVNKCVSYPGEFVVTYPYGYHSGYNLGYNCAEAVNFALDSWLPMGKIAKKCECAQAQDSVWIDVYAIERKLRGEETDYEETEDEEDEEEDEDELDAGMPTPRSSHIKFKVAGTKRKRTAADKGAKKVKKIRLRLKSHADPPCCLCPHDIPSSELLPTDDNRKAHRLCALYGAETWIETIDGKEIVANTANISKARLDLKCLFCRSKRGACFQCSHKKCARSYHATCAAPAGVFVEEAEIPIFGEDGTEYKEQAFEFTCRFHRSKRDRKLDSTTLDDHQKTATTAQDVKKGDICQFQYYRGEIFAGSIVENRADEQTLLVDVLPNGARLEVEWKWLLLADPADLHLPHASSRAIPMPTSRKAKEHINATKRQTEVLPRAEEPFVDGGFTWAEFNHHELERNKFQVKVDLSKENQVWHYLGRFSTDARPQYTEDPKQPIHNHKSNFLETIPKPPPPPPQPKKPYGSTFSIHTHTAAAAKVEKPYQYKPRGSLPAANNGQFTAHQFTPKALPYAPQQFAPTNSPYTTSVFHNSAPQSASKPAPNYSVPQSTMSTPSPFYNFHPFSQNQQSQAKKSPSAQQVAASPFSLPAPQQSAYQPNHAIMQITNQPPGYGTSHRAPHTQQAQHPQHVSSKAMPTALEQPTTTPGMLSKLSTAVNNQPASRQPSLPRPAMPSGANGHSRNKSSVSSFRSLGIGAGQRMGTPPATYGHSRADSNTKSPFSHGFTQPPGLGPSPSPQNGQLFQAQARARSSSLASSISLNTPMTSSAIRPSSATSAQVMAGHLQSIISSNSPTQSTPDSYQKSAFFQVHHNRDSSTYRTPYAKWGGFTNGYEGNLRAHLLQRPEALFDIRRQSIGSYGTTPGLSSLPQMQPGRSFSSVMGSESFLGQHSPSATYNSAQPKPATLAAPPRLNEETGAGLHPAIRAHYAAMFQKHHSPAATPVEETKTAQSQPTLSNPSTPINPLTALPTSTSVHSSISNRAAGPSKTTTPIPPPLIPTTPTSPAVVKSVPAITKQTYIPPPRPWETLRIQKPAVQPTTPQFPSPAPTAISPRFATPTPAVQYSEREMLGPITQQAQAGEQPTHVESVGLPLPAVQQRQPEVDSSTIPGAVQQSQPPERYVASGTECDAVQQLHVSAVATSAAGSESAHTGVWGPPGSTTTSQPSADTGAAGKTAPVDVAQEPPGWTSTMEATTMGEDQTLGKDELPEVSDGSMELVESIIFNARRASANYFSTLM